MTMFSLSLLKQQGECQALLLHDPAFGILSVATPASVSEGMKSFDRTVDRHVSAVSNFFIFVFQGSWWTLYLLLLQCL